MQKATNILSSFELHLPPFVWIIQFHLIVHLVEKIPFDIAKGNVAG